MERTRFAGALLFFICHTPTERLLTVERPNLHVWSGSRLADRAIRAGLFEWLIEKSR